MMIFVVPIIAGIALAVFFCLEQHANNKRIERAETPVKHHDLTDNPAPVDVIDWTRGH